MKQRLLKRMGQWETSTDINVDDSDVIALVESVRDDLEKIYNTKRGTVLVDDNFGMPDFSYLMNGYAAPDVNTILQQIYLQTKQYESRLNSLKVVPVEQNKFPGKLQFQISAKLKLRDSEVPFSVSALLGDDGSVKLSV